MGEPRALSWTAKNTRLVQFLCSYSYLPSRPFVPPLENRPFEFGLNRLQSTSSRCRPFDVFGSSRVLLAGTGLPIALTLSTNRRETSSRALTYPNAGWISSSRSSLTPDFSGSASSPSWRTREHGDFWREEGVLSRRYCWQRSNIRSMLRFS